MKKYTKKEIIRRATTMVGVYSLKDLRVLRNNAMKIYRQSIKMKSTEKCV